MSAEILVAIVAMLVAARTDYRTLRAAVSVITNIIDAVSADIAVITPAFITYAPFT